VITVDLERLCIQPGYRILDIGCGTGRHTGEVNRFKKCHVVGTDLMFSDLQGAKERLTFLEKTDGRSGGWHLCLSDIGALSFDDEAFDAIICTEVLEHIRDENKAIDELNRVLKPGCILAVSVPRFLPEWICWRLSREYRTSENGHIRIYRKKKLIKGLTAFGFQCCYAHYAHSLHTPFWWLKCLVGPSRKNVPAVDLYHRFLTWDIFRKPWITRFLDRLMNPVLGKSLVLYFRKAP